MADDINHASLDALEASDKTVPGQQTHEASAAKSPDGDNKGDGASVRAEIHTLAAKDLTIGYGKRTVLSDVELSVQSGELLCLLGPNGVGKSTLFKSLLGLLPILGGEVLVDGKPKKEMSHRDFAKSVAYVPQNHSTAFPFNVIDMVLMGSVSHLGPLSNPSRDEYDIAEEILKSVGLEHLRNRAYTQLSGGEQQMTLIARAMMQDADILLMDEPTAALDVGNQMQVLSRVKQMASKGKGIIMVTHDPDQCFLCANKVVLIFPDGRFFAGSVDEVVTEENMKKAYGIESRILETSDIQGDELKAFVPLLESTT